MEVCTLGSVVVAGSQRRRDEGCAFWGKKCRNAERTRGPDDVTSAMRSLGTRTAITTLRILESESLKRVIGWRVLASAPERAGTPVEIK